MVFVSKQPNQELDDVATIATRCSPSPDCRFGVCFQPLAHLLAFCQGTFCPAAFLRAFVQQTGAALHTVTALHITVDDVHRGSVTHDGSTTANALGSALALLLGALPALQSLHCFGRLAQAFLHTAGERCPQLSALDLSAGDAYLPYLQNLLTLLPSLLPNVDLTLSPTGQLAAAHMQAARLVVKPHPYLPDTAQLHCQLQLPVAAPPSQPSAPHLQYP